MDTKKYPSETFPKSVFYNVNFGKVELFPVHKMVSNWLFQDSSKDDLYNEQEANLANAMAEVAEANGMSANNLQHLFPAVLRMLKSNSNWAK